MPPALEVDAAACAAACEAAPEYARQFEQLPRELAEARAALFSGDLMADMLRGAHRSLPAATDQRFNVEVLAGLLRAKATVAPRPAPGGGTVALSWDNVVFVPCDFSAEQTLADMGTYGGTLSARATIWRTPSGGGPPAGRCLGDMDIAFLHLMVGSSLDPRSDPRFENPHLPAGAFVVNGHPRAMASSLGLPALHAPLVFAPPASRKSTSAMMRFCNSRERCTLLLQGEAGRRVAVIAQGRRSAPAGAVLAALLGDDADEDAVEDLVRGASVGDRRLWAFLYEVVLAPLASDWRAEEGGRRRARERWNADSPSWPAPDIRAELLPGLGDARLPQLELLLRRLAIAEVYAAYDARDHPANLYACTPGTALAALAEERFEELGRALASWLSSDRAADEDSARTRVAALVKRVVIKKWHNRNWTGTWGMHRSLTQQLELLSPIMSAALVHTFRRRGGEKSLDPRGPRGADQVRKNY